MKPETNHDFHKKLISTFKLEAEEHLKTMSARLFELEGSPAAEAKCGIVETIFRAAHSMKGAARAINATDIEIVCQALESVLAAVQRHNLQLSPGLIDTLHGAVDHLRLGLVAAVAAPGSAQSPYVAPIIRNLEGVLKGLRTPHQTAEPSLIVEEQDTAPELKLTRPREASADSRPMSLATSILAETVRVPAKRLDGLLLQAEELIMAKLTADQRATELRHLSTALAGWERKWLRVSREGQRMRQWLETPENNDPGDGQGRISELLEFLDRGSAFIKTQTGTLNRLARAADLDRRSLAAMVDQLLEGTKTLLMVPCSSLLEVFPKLIRELSREQGKEVDLVIHGEYIEVDRRILEEMKDALIHLVRNSVDHGIEPPEERTRRGKPRHGTLTIAITPGDGNRVEIVIADDGAGIDPVRVGNAARNAGLLTAEMASGMSEEELLPYIYQSGISTSPLVTDISGRGLGLAIVREKVARLGGLILVENRRHQGTLFRVVLPLTLASLRGIFVRVAQQLLALPTTQVERVMRVPKTAVRTVENQKTITVGGQPIALVRLADVLRLSANGYHEHSRDVLQVVVLGSGERRVAYLVDEVVNEQEILVKSLGRQLHRVRNIAGATVMATGTVVPILNVADLLASVMETASAPTPPSHDTPPPEASKKSILLAEDSITSRMLLKNILETAGYQITTAVDGTDALALMRAQDFDLLISDVDMPGMNGFELTSKIRADNKLAELPVVLLTALGSKADRERGLEAGANAYLVKSEFDQSNLLEVIRRLA